METIEYKSFGIEEIQSVMNIYGQEGWNLYSDPQKVTLAFERSLFVLGAFVQDQLVGFIRCVGDGEYDVYVSDLIVHASYRRRGIGKTLLNKAMERYCDADTFGLMTGMEEEENQQFYRSMNMRPYADKRLIGFLRW